MLHYVDPKKLKLTTKKAALVDILDSLLFFFFLSPKMLKNHLQVLVSEGYHSPLSFFSGGLQFVRKCDDGYS